MDVSKNVNSYELTSDNNSHYFNIGTGQKEIAVIPISKNDRLSDINIRLMRLDFNIANSSAVLHIAIVYQSTAGTVALDGFTLDDTPGTGIRSNVTASLKHDFAYDGFISVRIAVGAGLQTSGDGVFVVGYRFEKLTY